MATIYRRGLRLSSLGLPQVAAMVLLCSPVAADPCGMVPPFYQGPGSPIVRVDLQKTYIFHKDGIETFVIRPGFSGKVEEFGMLIPFPTPPAIRKVPDEVFQHLAAAVDPPEVIVDLTPRPTRDTRKEAKASSKSEHSDGALAYDTVRVLRQEAIGMYEVAVLEAGSAAALKKWMDQHGFRFPTGMEGVCQEFVERRWCFVAEKTRVGQKAGIEPRPGQRRVNSKLPEGATFDGYVQGMAFRFKSEKFEVPMRLSAFNEGPMRNIVYLLTDGPRKIASMPDSFVVRQLSGTEIFRNVTEPLPLRVVGGEEKDIPDWRKLTLPKERDPRPHNGVARDLFAADLQAVKTGQLALAHEESEKVLLRIGERLGLRGPEIDGLHAAALADQREATVKAALADVKELTLTLVDGDFPREVVARENLTFPAYKMASAENSATKYDAKQLGPPQVLPGNRLGWREEQRSGVVLAVLVGLVVLGFGMSRRRGRSRIIGIFVAGAAALLSAGLARAEPAKDSYTKLRVLVQLLRDPARAEEAVEALAAQGTAAVPLLCGEAIEGTELAARGWAIAALAEIGAPGVDEFLQKLHEDAKQPPLVRTWAAAGRVRAARDAAQVVERVPLVSEFPAIGRPLVLRLAAVAPATGQAPVEAMLTVAVKYPQMNASLAPMILSHGAKPLAKVLVSARDDTARYQAAAYLGTLAGQGDKSASQEVCRAYAFDAKAKGVPWSGGALYLPGLAWSQAEARELVGSLVAWHLWCERHGLDAERQKIQTNLMSVGLSRAAGYQMAHDGSAQGWLLAWGNVVGRREIEKLLAAQGADDDAKYAGVLEGIKE